MYGLLFPERTPGNLAFLLLIHQVAPCAMHVLGQALLPDPAQHSILQ